MAPDAVAAVFLTESAPREGSVEHREKREERRKKREERGVERREKWMEDGCVGADPLVRPYVLHPDPKPYAQQWSLHSGFCEEVRTRTDSRHISAERLDKQAERIKGLRRAFRRKIEGRSKA
jgi:hypothetical protein